MAGLDGSCQTPLAGHAVRLAPNALCLTGLVAACDGSEIIRQSLSAPASEPGAARALGLKLARQLKHAGADKSLNKILEK